jgi:hypothetical protein
MVQKVILDRLDSEENLVKVEKMETLAQEECLECLALVD